VYALELLACIAAAASAAVALETCRAALHALSACRVINFMRLLLEASDAALHTQLGGARTVQWHALYSGMCGQLSTVVTCTRNSAVGIVLPLA
jgi:hypothetical protein